MHVPLYRRVRMAKARFSWSGSPGPRKGHHSDQVTAARNLQLTRYFSNQIKKFSNLKDLLTSDWRALYRVSAILRALMNQLLAHWEASRHPTTTASPEQLKKSVQLVTTLGKARLIPPILADTALMYEFVAPYDLFLLMNAIWGFLHCNPANQELGWFRLKLQSIYQSNLYPKKAMVDSNYVSVNVDVYLQDARNILLKHIEKTAHIYHKFYC